MRTFFLLLFVALFSGMSFGQNSMLLLSDRPGHTLSAKIVSPGQFLIQSGFSYAQLKEEYSSLFFLNTTESKYSGLQNTVRLGLATSLEAYLTINATRIEDKSRSENLQFNEPAYVFKGIPSYHQNIELGIRKQFKNSEGVNFTGILGFGPQIQYFRVGAMFSSQIGQSIVALNAHVFTNLDFEIAAAYSARYSYVFDKIGWYAELWGGPDNNFSMASALSGGTGFSLQLSPAFMIDLGGNYHLSEYADEYIDEILSQWSVEIGVSYLISE